MRRLGHSECVDLDPGGHPLHTRALSVGIIHLMRVEAVVDPATRILERIEATQPAVAFEPSAATEGECCRDPVDQLAAVAGTRLDDGFFKRLGVAIGGPRGCSHVLTLTRLLVSTVREVLDAGTDTGAFARGERIFRRDLVIDGSELADRRLVLAAQLMDLCFAPSAPVAAPMDRFGSEVEVRLAAAVDMSKASLVDVRVAERRRSLEEIESAEWRECEAGAAAIEGLTLFTGIAGILHQRLGERAEDRPLLDLALNLTPAFHQCVAGLSESWAVFAKRNPSVLGTAGPPDSCYMWRRGGALGRVREREGEKSPLGRRR